MCRTDGCLAILNIILAICVQTETPNCNSGDVGWPLVKILRRFIHSNFLQNRLAKGLTLGSLLGVSWRTWLDEGCPTETYHATAPELRVDVSVWAQMDTGIFNMAKHPSSFDTLFTLRWWNIGCWDCTDKESHTINARVDIYLWCLSEDMFFFVFPENMKRRYMFCLEKQLWQPVQVFFLLQHVRCIDWLHIYVYDLSQRGLSSPQKVQLPVQVSWPAATELRSASSPFPSCHL